MLLNCGVGEDSWESFGLQGDPTSPSKGDQSCVFIGRTDVEAETPNLWPLDVKSWLIWKDTDIGKDWRQEEKGWQRMRWLDGITNSQSLLKLMSIRLVMPSNHLILCRALLLRPSIFPSIRVFSNESALLIRWPKYWSFSFSISPSNEHPGLISFRMDWLDLLAVQVLSRVFSNTTVQKHQFFGARLSL